jgi:spore maturation protein CgeB
MVKVFNASKIVLNFLPPHMPKGGNLRTFEIPGSGAFQLASRCPSAWFKPGREIALFSSLADLRHKISYYLQHTRQRQAIAHRGYLRTHRDHTYRHRFSTLLNLP